MEALVIGFFIIGIPMIILLSILGGDEQEARKNRVEQFMYEMRNKDFALTVNIKGDLNGTIVLGDLTIKDSYNSINNSDKVLAAAVAEMGEKIKTDNNNSQSAEKAYPEFKKLVGYLALGQIVQVKNTWDSFLALYPSIEKDMTAYLIIEDYIKRSYSMHQSGSDGCVEAGAADICGVDGGSSGIDGSSSCSGGGCGGGG